MPTGLRACRPAEEDPVFRRAARSRLFVPVLLAAATAAATAVAGPAATATAETGVRAAAPTGLPVTTDHAARAWAAGQLSRMTLEEKVGQLFVTYAYGSTVDTTAPADVAANRAAYGVDNAAQLIDRYRLGGVIYFAWSNNVVSPAQIAGLSNGIQRVAARQRVPVPMLISTDQEQGVVVRVGPPATQFPGNMALGAGRSTLDAYTAARITGRELRALGINQNFAPVADVNVNPANPVIGVRSFGSDPQLVARLAAAQVDGYQRSVSSTAKHFPGHGDTEVDSHTGIPVIDHTREEWERIDRPPFAATIARGIDSIMTAHIVVPALDPSGDPATLSRPIMTGILRGELGFDGVVITDALGMAGVRQKYGDARVPVLALQAGVDQLLMPPDLELAYTSVLAAVGTGELTEQRIDESVLRVLRMKYLRGLVANPYVDESAVDQVVGTPAHLAAAQRVTDRTVTLVKNDGGLLPLAAGSGRRVLVTGWGVATTAELTANLGRRGLVADALETGTAPTQAQIDAAVAAAGSHDLVLVSTNRAWSSAQQQQLVRALLATGKPVIAVAVRDPYDVAYFPTVPAYLASYSYTAVSLESVTRVLFGEVRPTGRLPVTIPVAGSDEVLYPYGHGLTLRPRPVARLRVATYNIAAGAGPDGVFDLDRTAAAIRGLRADVVALQEVDVHWSARSEFRNTAAELGRRLRMRVFFAPIYSLDPATPGGPAREFGVALLSRLPVQATTNHRITRLSTQVPNPTPAPAPGFGEIEVLLGGTVVHVYATHLDYRPDPAVRHAQVADMLRILAEDTGPQVLLGDLNATADAPELAPLWAGLLDAWPAAHGPAGGETYPATAPVRRIDYVTARRGIRVGGVAVPAPAASDHRPVVADLLVPR
jgi:beta-glucosidase-like glycosyl hydrolase/endonuclease/exonuclease/phosphatase family metal-dependent hydrolase